MCGIAGYVGKTKPSSAMKLAFFIMASEMDDRGGHSWGWTDWENVDKGLKFVRDGLEANHLISPRAAIHTRFGTTGEKIASNSHPFIISAEKPTKYAVWSPELQDDTVDQIIGMHNGIVYNHFDLNREYKRKCEVDSMHIFHHIVNGLPLDDIEAYGAIIYEINGVIYGGRFNGGELTIALTKEGLIYASTKYAVERALEISGIELIHYFNVKDGELYQFEADNLYLHGSIDMKESLYSYKWNDAKYQQDKWWEKSEYGYPDDKGTEHLSWEDDLERLDSQNDVSETDDMAYLGEFEECEMCQLDTDELYYHREDDALVCSGCAWDLYNHATKHTYEVVPNARFKCDDCKCEYGADKRHGQSKYVVDVAGLTVCPACFFKNYYCPQLVLVGKDSILVPNNSTKALAKSTEIVKATEVIEV